MKKYNNILSYQFIPFLIIHIMFFLSYILYGPLISRIVSIYLILFYMLYLSHLISLNISCTLYYDNFNISYIFQYILYFIMIIRASVKTINR